MYLNTESPVGGTVWGDGTSLEEVYHWGWPWRVYSLVTLPVLSLSLSIDFQCVKEMGSLSFLFLLLSLSYIMDSVRLEP